MPKSVMLGRKLRRIRRQSGFTQTKTAERLGISASYLNLIEHNQRPLTLPILIKVARLFDINLQTFATDDEARLHADLSEVMGDSLFAGLDLGSGDMEDLSSSLPQVGRAFRRLYTAYRNSLDNFRLLGERLSYDTFMTSSGHELLTLLTSIRSFSEILHDNRDLESSERERFLGILVGESEQLTRVINQFMDFSKDGGLESLLGASSPSEEAQAVIEHHDNHFPAIEQAADALRSKIGDDPDLMRKGLARLLSERHGLEVQVAPWDSQSVMEAHLDEEKGRLYLSKTLLPSRIAFRMACHVGRLSCGEVIEDCMSDARLTSNDARTLCRQLLTEYFAGALLIPYTPFLETARERRYDIELLQQRFGASFEQVCQRLATLRRPGESGLPFHFLRIDIAGNISKRFSGSGMRIPRFGGACPRWNVHAAFMTPGIIHTQIDRFPDGADFFNLARTVTVPGGSYHAPRSHLTICIGCKLGNARDLVYADGLDLAAPEAAVPVGVTCQLCERADCSQRAFPSLIRRKVIAD